MRDRPIELHDETSFEYPVQDAWIIRFHPNQLRRCLPTTDPSDVIHLNFYPTSKLFACSRRCHQPLGTPSRLLPPGSCTRKIPSWLSRPGIEQTVVYLAKTADHSPVENPLFFPILRSKRRSKNSFLSSETKTEDLNKATVNFSFERSALTMNYWKLDLLAERLTRKKTERKNCWRYEI